MGETSATSSSCKVGVSAPGVDTAVICSKITEGSAARRRGNKCVSAPGVDTNSAAGRRGVKSASTPGVDDAASSVGGCKRPTPGKLACIRAAGLHDDAICNQAGLDCVRPRKESADGSDNGNPSKAGPGRGTSGAGLHKKKRRRKHHKLRKSRSGTKTLQEMSAGQTSDTTSSVETLNVLTRTRTGLQYRSMELENPPTSASELTSLPAMSWMRFAKDLFDGRIEQICILSDLERMKSEAEELRQLHAASTTESEDTLSAKTKKERFDGQSWDSLKTSPFYDVLREHKDVLPDEIPAELLQDKGIQHEIGYEVLCDAAVTTAARSSKGDRRLLRESSLGGTSAGIEVPAQCINVLCQEATGRKAHRSCLQQAERYDDTGADADTTKICEHRFDGQEHHLQCS
ncbi:hypothetical protein PC120_g23616 [Phytophthora cactorum]|nr:hypothetical protein PC120_g23616 [Phytophthora cactorum]